MICTICPMIACLICLKKCSRVYRRNEMLKRSCVQASETCKCVQCISWVNTLSLTQFCSPRYLGFGFGPCSAVYVEIWCVKDMLYAGLAPRHQLAVCVVVLSDVCVDRSPRLWHSD